MNCLYDADMRAAADCRAKGDEKTAQWYEKWAQIVANRSPITDVYGITERQSTHTELELCQ